MKESRAQKKFLKIVREKKYFDQHHRVLIAISGGLDSMTLFNWLYDAQKELHIELGMAHINHGVRKESDAEEEALHHIAVQKNVPFFVGRFTGKFTEKTARDFRYHFFEKIMKEEGYTALVTAHHQGDLVETVLMREITGRNLRSLQGIKEKRNFAGGELIRPLLSFTKNEFDAPLFFEDRTNQDNHYFRNRIRNQYIEELSHENPQFSAGIADLSDEIRLAFSVITDSIQHLCVITDNTKKVDLAIFLDQSEGLQYFILQEYLTCFPELQLTKAKVAELLHILRREQQYHAELNKDYLFIKNPHYFYLEKKGHFASNNWEEEIEILYEDPKDTSYLEVSIPQNGAIEIRRRLPHDEILINGNHKKLRKFFIEKHVPLEKRNNYLILVDQKIYAIVDLACSDLSKVAKNDKMKRILWVKPILGEDN